MGAVHPDHQLYESLKISGEAKQAAQRLLQVHSLNDASRAQGRQRLPLHCRKRIDASEHQKCTDRNIDRNTWVTTSVQRSMDRCAEPLQDGLAFLATSAPPPRSSACSYRLGHLPRADRDRIAGQASIDKVAGPVGEALIMTASGLAVAVPAVLATTGWCAQQGHDGIGAQLRLGPARRADGRQDGQPLKPRSERHHGHERRLRFREDEVVSAINTTPLVDVMLVLLITS